VAPAAVVPGAAVVPLLEPELLPHAASSNAPAIGRVKMVLRLICWVLPLVG
jgi:hypothetical protein